MWSLITGALISATLLITFGGPSRPHRTAALFIALNAVATYAVVLCPVINELPEILLWKSVIDAATVGAIRAFSDDKRPDARVPGLTHREKSKLALIAALMITAHGGALLLTWNNWGYPNRLYLAALDLLYWAWLFNIARGAAQHGFSLSRLGVPDLRAAVFRLLLIGFSR